MKTDESTSNEMVEVLKGIQHQLGRICSALERIERGAGVNGTAPAPDSRDLREIIEARLADARRAADEARNGGKPMVAPASRIGAVPNRKEK